MRRHVVDGLLIEGLGAVLEVGPFFLDAPTHLVDAECLGQDLDARLELVVAATELVVDPQHCLEVGQQVLPGQVLADGLADHRSTAETATDQHLHADVAGVVAPQTQTDVVDLNGGTILGGAGHGDLELARQVVELRVEGRPLTNQLTPGARIHFFIGSDAGELVGGGVADIVAAGLDRVHLHAGELCQHFGHVLELRPVQLKIGTGGEVAVAAVIAGGQLTELAQLVGGQHAIGDGDAKHGRVTLYVQTVLHPDREEFFLADLAFEVATHLVAELCDAFVDQGLIMVVVAIHSARSCSQGMTGRCGLLYLHAIML